MRGALARAVEHKGELVRSDWRVLAACIVLVGSYSRTSDRVYLDQIAEAAGLTRSPTSKSLKKLNALGVIKWEGSSRRGRGSSLDIDPISF